MSSGEDTTIVDNEVYNLLMATASKLEGMRQNSDVGGWLGKCGRHETGPFTGQAAASSAMTAA